MEHGGQGIFQFFQDIFKVGKPLVQHSGRGRAGLRSASQPRGVEIRLVRYGKDRVCAIAGAPTEKLPALIIDQLRDRIGKTACLTGRISRVWTADRVHMQHPPRPQKFDRVIELRGLIGQLVRCGAGRILSSNFPSPQKGTVFIQDHTRRD